MTYKKKTGLNSLTIKKQKLYPNVITNNEI